jgi:hypothetical protein
MAAPGASGATPEEGTREEGEPPASHPEASGSETSQPEATHSGAHQAASSGYSVPEREGRKTFRRVNPVCKLQVRNRLPAVDA